MRMVSSCMHTNPKNGALLSLFLPNGLVQEAKAHRKSCSTSSITIQELVRNSLKSTIGILVCDTNFDCFRFSMINLVVSNVTKLVIR